MKKLKTEKWLRVFVFTLGITLIILLLMLGNINTKRLYVTPTSLIELDSLEKQLYLLEPDWEIELDGDYKVYSTDLNIFTTQAYSGIYLPRAENTTLTINQSTDRVIKDGPRLMYLFEPMPNEQTVHIELQLPIKTSENASTAQLYIGRHDEIMGAKSRESQLRLFILGLSLAIILFSMSLYLQKPSEKYLLSLAFMVYSTLGFILLQTFPILREINITNFFLLGAFKIPFISMETSTEIHSIIFLFLVGVLDYFIIKNFVSAKLFKIDYFYFILPASIIMLLLIGNPQFPLLMVIYRTYISLLESIIIIKGDYKHGSEPKILLIGSIVAVAVSIFRIIAGYQIIPHGNVDLLYRLGGIPGTVYAIAFTTAISGIFTRKFVESEALSEELEMLNRDLQKIVDKRTVELETAYARLEKQQKQKDIFITNMVHSLKSPLFSIAGFADMAQETLQTNPEKVEHFIKLINTNADYVVKLVNNLFLALRLEYGEVKYMIENLDVGKMMEQIYNTTLSQTEQKEIQLTLEIPEKPLMIESDLNYLTLAIQNIADNAIRHTSSGGEIKLAVTDLGTQTEISVLDNGEGMPEEVVQRIYERYYSHSSRGNISSGLGLSISKDVITALQGQIIVKSTLGKGSAFSVILPKKNQSVGNILTP